MLACCVMEACFLPPPQVRSFRRHASRLEGGEWCWELWGNGRKTTQVLILWDPLENKPVVLWCLKSEHFSSVMVDTSIIVTAHCHSLVICFNIKLLTANLISHPSLCSAVTAPTTRGRSVSSCWSQGRLRTRQTVWTLLIRALTMQQPLSGRRHHLDVRETSAKQQP